MLTRILGGVQFKVVMPDEQDLWDVTAQLCQTYIQAHTMTATLSIRLDLETRKKLDSLALRSRRSKSFLAAEAIAQYVAAEEWQLGEIQAAIEDIESGRHVSHEKVTNWLKSWGKSGKTSPPR
jgi:predicted transcriptional regulator